MIDSRKHKYHLESFIKALDKGDKNVYFIDGDSLFTGVEYDGCTVDGCHPNDLGFYRIAYGIMPIIRKVLFNKQEGD